MNKKLLFLMSIIVCFCLFNINVNAATDNCSHRTSEEKCEQIAVCRWTGSSCVETYVAELPCDENAIRRVLKIFGYILLVAKVAIPLIIIGFGTFDLFKAVVDKDDKSLPKQVKRLMIRVVTGFIVFFVPNIIHALFTLSESLNIIEDTQYKTCVSCILDPTNESTCKVD